LFTAFHVHLVFTPKYRRGPFTSEILRRCEEIMRDVFADFGAELHEFNGEADHVYLLVHYPPRVCPIPPGRLSQGRLCPAAATGVPRAHPQVPVGRAFLVPVLLRHILRRRAAGDHNEYIEQQRRPA
jgi:hypothetical protein